MTKQEKQQLNTLLTKLFEELKQNAIKNEFDGDEESFNEVYEDDPTEVSDGILWYVDTIIYECC